MGGCCDFRKSGSCQGTAGLSPRPLVPTVALDPILQLGGSGLEHTCLPCARGVRPSDQPPLRRPVGLSARCPLRRDHLVNSHPLCPPPRCWPPPPPAPCPPGLNPSLLMLILLQEASESSFMRPPTCHTRSHVWGTAQVCAGVWSHSSRVTGGLPLGSEPPRSSWKEHCAPLSACTGHAAGPGCCFPGKGAA